MIKLGTVEQEESPVAKLAALRDRERQLSEKLRKEEDFAKTFLELEQVRDEIQEISSTIPSSGDTGMIGSGTLKDAGGPEAQRFSDKKEK